MLREHSFFRRGWGWGGWAGGIQGSLNFYMVKKGVTLFFTIQKGGGGQEISAHLLSSTWLNNVPINIYSEVERTRKRLPCKLTFIH